MFEATGKTLDGIRNEILEDIKAIPNSNIHRAEYGYEVIRERDVLGQYLKVQHVTVQGVPDRVIAVIRDDEKPEGHWFDD